MNLKSEKGSIFGIIGFLVVLMVVIAILSTDDSSADDVISDINQTYYIGDTVEFKDFSVTLNNYEIKNKGTFISDTEYIDAPQWIAITFTYTNTSDETSSLHRNVRLINSSGEIIPMSTIYYEIWNTNYLEQTELVKGGSKTGFLQFANTLQDSPENITVQVSRGSSFKDAATFSFKLTNRP